MPPAATSASNGASGTIVHPARAGMAPIVACTTFGLKQSAVPPLGAEDVRGSRNQSASRMIVPVAGVLYLSSSASVSRFRSSAVFSRYAGFRPAPPSSRGLQLRGVPCRAA